MKYTKEVKEKCVKAALEGRHLKSIAIEFGPNPKAIMRYLKKAGHDYKKILADLKAKGKTPLTPLATAKIKGAERKAAKKEKK